MEFTKLVYEPACQKGVLLPIWKLTLKFPIAQLMIIFLGKTCFDRALSAGLQFYRRRGQLFAEGIISNNGGGSRCQRLISANLPPFYPFLPFQHNMWQNNKHDNIRSKCQVFKIAILLQSMGAVFDFKLCAFGDQFALTERNRISAVVCFQFG